jgi:hypothetical protein
VGVAAGLHFHADSFYGAGLDEDVSPGPRLEESGVVTELEVLSNSACIDFARLMFCQATFAFHK